MSCKLYFFELGFFGCCTLYVPNNPSYVKRNIIGGSRLVASFKISSLPRMLPLARRPLLSCSFRTELSIRPRQFIIIGRVPVLPHSSRETIWRIHALPGIRFPRRGFCLQNTHLLSYLLKAAEVGHSEPVPRFSLSHLMQFL